MTSRSFLRTSLVAIVVLGTWIVAGQAHRSGCHGWHSCPSDERTYVCGDRGHRDQCPDNQFCLAGKPRVTAPPSPAATSPASLFAQSLIPVSVTVCFTPGGNCTDAIVQALGNAKRTILVQAYDFTSAPNLAAQYTQNWKTHRQHSQAICGARGAPVKEV
jgi:hypothetical protein